MNIRNRSVKNKNKGKYRTQKKYRENTGQLQKYRNLQDLQDRWEHWYCTMHNQFHWQLKTKCVISQSRQCDPLADLRSQSEFRTQWESQRKPKSQMTQWPNAFGCYTAVPQPVVEPATFWSQDQTGRDWEVTGLTNDDSISQLRVQSWHREPPTYITYCK